MRSRALLFGLITAVMPGSTVWAAEPPRTPPATKAPSGAKRPKAEYHEEARPRELMSWEQNLYTLIEFGFQRMQAERFEEALKLFNAAAERAPLEPRPHYFRAICYKKMGRLKEAEEDFRQGLALDPKAHDDQTVIARTQLGALLADSGRASEAAEILEQAVLKNPNSFEAQFNLGVAQGALKHYTEAIAAYKRAVKLKPSASLDPVTPDDAYLNLGTILSRTGQLQEALVAMRQAVSLAPDKPSSHFNLGLLLSTAKRYNEAVAELTAAAQLAERNANEPSTKPEARESARKLRDKALWRLGVVHLRRAAPVDAISSLERAKSLQVSAEVLTDLGEARLMNKEPVRAESEFRAALRLNPHFVPARLHLAALLATTARCAEGLDLLKQVPNEPEYIPSVSRIQASCTKPPAPSTR